MRWPWVSRRKLDDILRQDVAEAVRVSDRTHQGERYLASAWWDGRAIALDDVRKRLTDG